MPFFGVGGVQVNLLLTEFGLLSYDSFEVYWVKKLMETKRTKLFLLKKEDYQEVLEMFRENDTFKYIEPLQNKSEAKIPGVFGFQDSPNR